MAWLHDVEVALVQRYQLGDVEALGQSDDTGIGRAERQVGVPLNQIGGASEIVSGGVHNIEESGLERCRNRAPTEEPASRASR